MPGRTPHRISSLAIVALLGVASQSGCVALNIPSERLHDATDGGGVFGHWKGVSAHPSTHPHHGVVMDQGALPVLHGDLVSSCDQPHCLGGGPLECDPLGGCDPAEVAEEPEIPWPRFHPVPTRPVFGPPSHWNQ